MSGEESFLLPIYPWPMSLAILSFVLILRYFLLSGVFYWLCIKKKLVPIGNESPDKKQIKRDALWSIISSIVFAGAGTVLIILWQNNISQIYIDFRQYPLWYLPVSLATYMAVHDTYFYWTHRLLHRHMFKNCHSIHHQSSTPTAWTSFSFHPIEAFIQAMILPILVLLIPTHWTVLALFLSLMSLFGVLNHLGYELYPSLLEKYLGLINATHHQRHHRHTNYNYGLYFNWWDRFMKTEWSRK